MALVPFGNWFETAASEETGQPLQPVVGWRVWALRDGRLASWASPYTWEPGENVACCLVPPPPIGCLPPRGPRCSEPPGRGCGCGFWAVFSPLLALKRARSMRQERNSVLGLVRGWGSTALHGAEGFRAQRAEVICLFPDWCWDSPVLSGRPAGIRFRLGARAWRLRAVAPGPSRLQWLEEAARSYGVPLLSLKSALAHGVLAELGVDLRGRRQVQAWVKLTTSAPVPVQARLPA